MNPIPAVLVLQAEGGPGLGWIVFPATIFLIFYLLVFRPQSRLQKERDRMRQSVEKGDRVVTEGGIHGMVTGTADNVLTLEIANVRGERVRVKVDRIRIDRIEKKTEKTKGGEGS